MLMIKKQTIKYQSSTLCTNNRWYHRNDIGTFWALLWYSFLLSVAGTILSPTAFFAEARSIRTRLVPSMSVSSVDGFSSRSMEIIHFQSYRIECCSCSNNVTLTTMYNKPFKNKVKLIWGAYFHGLHVIPNIINDIRTQDWVIRKFP